MGEPVPDGSAPYFDGKACLDYNEPNCEDVLVNSMVRAPDGNDLYGSRGFNGERPDSFARTPVVFSLCAIDVVTERMPRLCAG